MHGEDHNHPAFGQIVAHRIRGTRNLYGSDFEHHAFIRVTVARSVLCRNLSSDWYHPRDTLIEVDLSEAQWATFVSSLNVGAGTPCTIDFIGGEGHMPELPRVDRKAQFGHEFDERLSRSTQAIREARDLLDSLGLPKGKAGELRAKLEGALTNLNSNLSFVSKRFGEHMEETVENAKAEVHGYIHNHITRAGLDAITARSEVVSLPAAGSEDEQS